MADDDGVPAGRAMAEVLARAGITTVFGVPGGYTIKLFEGVRDTPGIEAVLAPHEQVAACMADMVGRLTGRPAVVSGQGAFVGGSAGFGIMEAALSGTPMVVITEMTDHGLPQHAATQSVTGDFGTVDLPGILRAMCKDVTVATTPNEAVHAVELAIDLAMADRPGPVAVVCRLGALYGRTDTGPRARPRLRGRASVRPTPPHADPGAVAALAERLSTARFPVIVAGNGTRGHGAALAALAQRAAAPVVTTQKARGAVADVHPWAAGPLGPFGSPIALDTLATADVVLVLGSRLNPADTAMESRALLDPDRQHLVHVDCRAAAIGRSIPVAEGIVADIGTFLAALAPLVGVEESLVDERWACLEGIRAAHDHDAPAAHPAREGALAPSDVVAVLSAHLGARHRVVLDAGNNRIFNYRYLRMPEHDRIHLAGGHLGMGWGPAAALGAALERPDERIVAVVGDGGMLMSLNTLPFAAEHRLPITFVVMDNGVLGNVLDALQGGRSAIDLPPVDYAAVARSIGVHGERVADASGLADALRRADDHDGPVLLDVAVDPSQSSATLRARVG